MILDFKFIIASSILLAFIIPLYIYRKKVFAFAYKKGGIEQFILDIKLHMKKEHPKIPIDYSIIDETKNEKDIRIRETLIVEDIINQFYNHEYLKMTQAMVSKDKLWNNYNELSSNNLKVPSDWKRRRELAHSRDNEKCNRCGTKSKFENSHTIFVKDIKDGGGYNLENLITLCSDCNRILNSQNPKNTMSSLNLNDKLMVFVEA